MRLVYLHLLESERAGWYQSEEEVKYGDLCLVESSEGMRMAEVKGVLREVTLPWVAKLPKVIRTATEEDIQHWKGLKEKKEKAFKICEEKIREQSLPMKLIDVFPTFDGDKIIFYFSAPQRVDFRRLVRELAKVFRVRIEMRQVGARDKARILKGFGPCGLPLCCASHLKSFEAVSVRMAKEQDLSMDPFKIGGWCGRLMCCLWYELSLYRESKKNLPRPGTIIKTPEGEGEVIKVNALKETFTVLLKDGRKIEMGKDLYQQSLYRRISRKWRRGRPS